MDDLSKQKIVWGELSDEPKFALDNTGEYSLINTIFLMTGKRLPYLLAFLNSPVSKYYFSTNIATTSGVGTIRWLKYTIETLPIPQVSKVKENEIVAIVRSTQAGTDMILDSLVYSLYGFEVDERQFIASYFVKD